MRIRFLILGILFFGALTGEVVEMSSMEDVRHCLMNADEETLVLFDIDHTLLIPGRPEYQMPNVLIHKQALRANKPKWTADQKMFGLNYLVMNGGGMVVMDPVSVQCVRELQERDIPVAVLTGTLTGSYGEVADGLTLRQNQLAKNGFDFSKGPFQSKRLVYRDLKPFLGHFPESESGIICANAEENTKGEVLLEFLRHQNWEPKKVIFIDDRLDNVETMEESLSAVGIGHIGIHYTGINEFISEPVSESDFIKAWLELFHQSMRYYHERIEFLKN